MATRDEWKRLGARLRIARHLADLTQGEAARKLRRTQKFISNCELGQRRVDVLELEAFSELYGTSVMWLLDRE